MNCARPDLWEADSGNWPVDPTFRRYRQLLAASVEKVALPFACGKIAPLVSARERGMMGQLSGG